MPWLVNLLGGTAVSTIATALNQAYSAKLAADTDEKRIAADTLIAALKTQQATQQAMLAHWWTALPMVLIGLSTAIYYFKVTVWDSCFGLGSTPVIHGAVGEWMGIVVTSTFGVGTAGLAGIIASRFGGK